MALRIEKAKERLAKRKRDSENSASESGEKRSKTCATKDADCTGPKPLDA